MFGVNKYGNVEYLKNLGSPAKLLETSEYKEFNSNIYSDHKFIVGHNRKGTKGALSEENAHPFVEGSTILVHNGTIFNQTELTDTKTEVDSHAILHSIVEQGYEKTIKEIYGAFTLVWYDANDKHLRIIRNQERPMFIANTVGAWIFASERKMLEWICERNDTKITELTECVPGTMYSFNLDDKEGTMWMKKLKLRSNNQKQNSAKAWHWMRELEEDSPKKDDKTDTKSTGGVYNQEDFKIGSKITFSPTKVTKMEGDNNPDKGKYSVVGNWYLDPSVTTRVVLTEEQLLELETELDSDLDVNDILLSGELQTIFTHSAKKRTHLVLRNATPFQMKKDLQGNELYEDQFNFTDKACSHCCKTVEFNSLTKGVFKFETEEDFEIMCPSCVEKTAA